MNTSSRQDADRVLQILRETPEGLTAAELAKALQMDKQQVQTAVRNVVALHLVEAPRDAYAPKNYRRSVNRSKARWVSASAATAMY